MLTRVQPPHPLCSVTGRSITSPVNLTQKYFAKGLSVLLPQYTCVTLRCPLTGLLVTLDNLVLPYLPASLLEARFIVEWDRIPRTTPWETMVLRAGSTAHKVGLKKPLTVMFLDASQCRRARPKDILNEFVLVGSRPLQFQRRK